MKKALYKHLTLLAASLFIAESASAALMATPHDGFGEDVVHHFRWPGGVIPYRIDPNLHTWRLTAADPADRLTHSQVLAEQADTRAKLEAAIADWENKTEGVIDFVEIDASDLNSYEKSVLVTDQEGWYCASPSAGGMHAELGPFPGEHPVYLPPVCSPATVKHEMGHVIGLLHQHQSPHRDYYVTFNESNMRYYGVAGKEDLHKDDMWNMRNLRYFFVTQIGLYDYESIMHYGPHALGKSGAGPTLVPINPPWAVIGYEENGGVISQGDIDAVNVMYGRSKIFTVFGDCLQTSPNIGSSGGSDFFSKSYSHSSEDHELYASSCTLKGYHEEWVLSPEGWLLSANGRCVSSVEIGPDRGYAVSRRCDGSDEQKWSYDNSTGFLKDYAGRCLQLTYDDVSNHLQEQIGDSNAWAVSTVKCRDLGFWTPTDLRWDFMRFTY